MASARIRPPLRWSLPGLQLAYSSAADGDQRALAPRTAWLATLAVRVRCIVPRQVHGVQVVAAESALEALATADGVVTADPGLALGVFGADCPGLCLAAADAFGVAHCGWRGTARGIVARLVEALTRLSRHPPSAWQAFIGPGISGAHYEVDAPVLTARAWPAAALAPARPGRALLDVGATVEHDLRALGVTAIARSGVCTASDDRLWSYRRRGPGQVQLLAAWRPVIA